MEMDVSIHPPKINLVDLKMMVSKFGSSPCLGFDFQVNQPLHFRG